MKTKLFTTEIEEPAALLKNGGLVAVPTETVYGLACNGLDRKAVERVYDVKGRPAVKPISLMVSNSNDIEKYCENIPKAAYHLANQFWPGPLTIVLKAKKNVPEIVRAGGETVGLRCPDHPVTLALLKGIDFPLAVPSANPSGKPSPKNADDVLAYYDGKIEAVIDGGQCGVGIESTLVDISAIPYRILREGALSTETIFSALAKSMTIIGITGGTGGGKTTALNILRDKGALVIDCDEVYHDLLTGSKPMLRELEAAFPGAFISGMLDRKELGKIVFSDENLLLKLNEITHKYVNNRVDELLREHAANGGSIAAIDAIALIEAGIDSKCKAVVGITAPADMRIKRLMQRENISEEYAAMRINAQKPDKFFEDNCDYILSNDSTIEVFVNKCENLFSKLIDNDLI